MPPQVDVFLSHNSKDKPSVRQIAESLEKSNLTVWLDEWELRPGTPWQVNIEAAIQNSRAIAVFIGPGGLGPWEEPEMRAALEFQVRNGNPVIPIMLPGVPESVRENLPLFLRPNTWVDFRGGLTDAQALERLRWGITGEKPARRLSPPILATTPTGTPASTVASDAVTNLRRVLLSGNVTYFLGSGIYEGEADAPPRACDIARSLLLELELIDESFDQLLPPVDIASLYYAIKSGDRILENRVSDLIFERSKVTPPLHECMVRLLLFLRARPPQRRARPRTAQLIVTTNLDVVLERALLRAGISFTRIVQHKSARRIDINEFGNVQLTTDNKVEVRSKDGQVKIVGRDQLDELDEVIATFGKRSIVEESERGAGGQSSLHALSLQDYTEPILYKFLGSQDIPNSCAISTEHYFEFARRVLRQNCIPAQITEIIGNSPTLFLGHSFLDPDFRLAYFTLLRKSLELATDLRYAVQLPPERYVGDIYRQMELKSRIWERVKEAGLRIGITTVEEHPTIFLQQLLKEM